MSLSRLSRPMPSRLLHDFFVPGPELAAIPRTKDFLLSAHHHFLENHNGQQTEKLWESFQPRNLRVYQDDKNHYSVSINLPEGMTASDISLKVDEKGNMFHLSGLRKETSEDGKLLLSQSQFIHRFTLDKDVEVEQLTAKLSDKGSLTLSAPKKYEPAASSIMKQIEITTEEQQQE
jgi:HSP20 family molecular chaperone IbpA